MLARGSRDRRYFQRVAERFGWLPFVPTQRGGVWLHAVSVGEVVSAVHLIEQLKNALPGTPVWVSVTTIAGRELAEKRLAHLADGIFHAPFDLVWIVRRVLRQLDPAVVAILETEIWPNLWRETKKRDAGLLVINGRISDRAWPRYRSLRLLFHHVVDHADHILAQSPQDADRFRQLVGSPDQVQNAGNLKYDAIPAAPAPAVREWIESIRPAKIWVAASTMPPVDSNDVDEDDIVIPAFAQLAVDHPRLLMVLAPRRPERFDEAAAKLERAGIRFVRRSALGPPLELPGVLLLDTIGELAGLFALADVVFMGGTLARRGGHNILEPAYFAKPIVIGPHMENFPEIAREFRESNAVREIASPTGLAPAVSALLHDPGRWGAEAQLVSARQRGATARAVEMIRHALDDHLPREAGLLLLRPLEWLWLAGTRFDRAIRSRPAELAAPVISIGNLSVGGAGKTPLALWLAEQLPNVAILTRGYGRSSPTPLIVPPGEFRPVAETGDEAQTLIRSGAALVGIGADRLALARRIEAEFSPDYFVLDDGFQHWPVARELDIVLIDAQDPLGGGRLLPTGRLREPIHQIERASVIVLTRVEPGRSYSALLDLLHKANPRAPVLRAELAPVQWMRGETPAELPHGPFAAICGLANPGSFRQTLARLGIRPSAWHIFPDHHAYTAGELAGLGPQPLLTTEKDWVKIREQGISSPVYWLKTQMQLTEPEFLLKMIARIKTASR